MRLEISVHVIFITCGGSAPISFPFSLLYKRVWKIDFSMSASTPVPDSFVLESSISFPLPSSTASIDAYRHANSELRVIFVHVPGPLTNAVVVVPTLVNDNAGLPHTLEHLVFCGSRNYPNKGYLDNLAARSLSMGTNAYTWEVRRSCARFLGSVARNYLFFLM